MELQKQHDAIAKDRRSQVSFRVKLFGILETEISKSVGGALLPAFV